MKKCIPTKEIIEDYKELTENKRELFQMLEDNGYDSMYALDLPFKIWVFTMRALKPIVWIAIPVGIIWLIISLF